MTAGPHTPHTPHTLHTLRRVRRMRAPRNPTRRIHEQRSVLLAPVAVLARRMESTAGTIAGLGPGCPRHGRCDCFDDVRARWSATVRRTAAAARTGGRLATVAAARPL